MNSIIDVSHHNGVLNFKNIVQNNPGVKKVIIKASEGYTFVDPKFIENVRNASASGLKVGAYHFARLISSKQGIDAILQARHFVNTINAVKADYADLVLDIETNDDKRSRRSVELFIKQFADEVKRLTNKEIVIYSYLSFLNEQLDPKHKLGVYALWLAQYTTATKSKVPTGWKSIYMWQHTDNLALKAVTGTVDASIYGNDKSQLA